MKSYYLEHGYGHNSVRVAEHTLKRFIENVGVKRKQINQLNVKKCVTKAMFNLYNPPHKNKSIHPNSTECLCVLLFFQDPSKRPTVCVTFSYSSVLHPSAKGAICFPKEIGLLWPPTFPLELGRLPKAEPRTVRLPGGAFIRHFVFIVVTPTRFTV